MKRSTIAWVLAFVMIGTIMFVFNSTPNKNTKSISEIFQDDDSQVEYEFIDIAAEKQEVVEEIVEEREEVNVKEKEILIFDDQAKIKASFVIQVASLKAKVNAEKISEDLISKGFSPFIVKRNLKDKGVWYRIYVGEFSTKEEAKELLGKIRLIRKNSFIIKL
ncbi:MAG: SPOR domain-containing protein [Candidatus Zapsychrus exili]|nr:SPOR domain-containing protein [Candidatus Zapsychrus exili]